MLWIQQVHAPRAPQEQLQRHYVEISKGANDDKCEKTGSPDVFGLVIIYFKLQLHSKSQPDEQKLIAATTTPMQNLQRK
jgi:hypothetical protein